MHKVSYCERHRIARLSQLGAVRADIEVEARLLQTVDYTRDTAFATLVHRTLLTEFAGLRADNGASSLELRTLVNRLGESINDAIRAAGRPHHPEEHGDASAKPPRKARRR
jgi:hypothetical protein